MNAEDALAKRRFRLRLRCWRGLAALNLTLGLAALGQEPSSPNPEPRQARLLVVEGAAGETAYGEAFAKQAALWEQTAGRAGMPCLRLGGGAPGQGTVKEELISQLQKRVQEAPATLWLVMVGHGTFDGREAKFNLPGPDVTPKDLAEALRGFAGELIFAHTGSASQPFAAALKGPRRVLVSATKNGDEVFFARFGTPFAEAIAGAAAADLDQDAQVSVLEAFLHASAKVRAFYDEEERIATEHALLDDNGDGVGTRAEVFEGLRPKAGTPEPVDGRRARQVALLLSEADGRLSETQRQRRDELEAQVEELKAQRAAMGDAAYYDRLEKLMRELGGLLLGSDQAAPPQ